MDPGQQKAFDIAAEVSKQLIALATGVLAVTITFSKDVFPNATGWLKYILAGALIAYLLSALCGIATLMCLAGGLEKPKVEAQRFSIYKDNIQRSLKAQVFLFCLATSLVVVFGVAAVFSSPSQEHEGSGTSMDVKFEKGHQGRAYIESKER